MAHPPPLSRRRRARGTNPSGSAHARKRARSRLRLPVLVTLSVLVVLLAAGAWVGSRAWAAKGELEQAQSLVSDLKAQVVAGDYAGVPDTFGEIRLHAQRARGFTEAPLWSTAEHVPFLGVNLTAMRGLTEVIDDAMSASEPLVSLAADLTPEALAPKDGVVPTEPFVQAAAELPRVAQDFAALRTQLEAVPTEGTVEQIQAAKATLLDAIDSASSGIDAAAPIVGVLPAILGADGPRTYVVMFLNNSELRSLGGTALSFAEITVDGGAIKLERVVPAGEGNFPGRTESLIPVPDGFDSIYPGALGRFIANATLRPSAVTAAEIVQAEWKSTFGTTVDGVISMDGGALSLLLKAVGPVEISTGDVVTSENVLSLLFNEVYARYNTGDYKTDNVQQGVVYSETVAGTFGKLTAGDFDPKVLFDTMSTAAAERGLSVWFADPAEQEVLASTSFAAQDLSESTATEDVVGVYLNNQSSSKLDYYLASTLTTGSAVCTPDARQVHRVTLDLTNELDPADVPDLSASISGSVSPRLGLVKGEDQLVVFVYLPQGATLLSASVDGTPVAASGHQDAGHPVQVLWVRMLAGATGQLSVDFQMGEPGDQELVAQVTPTVKGTTQATAPLECSSVALP